MPLTFSDNCPPIPPDELISRVTGRFNDTGGQIFDAHARTHLEQLERGLAVAGRNFEDFERVLDFGCGPGRFIRHLGLLAETVEIHGIDIDADAIEWASRHIDYAHFTVGPHKPPTKYEDGFFDLVVNHSVFTHLDAHYQDLWLAELRRLTRPDGILLLTVHGTRAWNMAKRGHEAAGEDVEIYQDPFEREGLVFYEEDSYIGSSHPEFYHSTFHAPWYVFEHWTAFFDLLAYVPAGSGDQDLVVLRRRSPDETVDQPIRHRSGVAAADVATPNQTSGAGIRERIKATVGDAWPPARTAAGRVKRRALRYERYRQDLINEELIGALEEIRAELDSLAARPSAELAKTERAIRMLGVNLYDQGQRIGLIAREVREHDDTSSASD